VKNLAFWVLEKTPIAEFLSHKLADKIMDAFIQLRGYLKDRFLPCYMIPERNLFDGRMDGEECELLLKEVDGIIDEGYAFLLQNHKLSLFMLKTHNHREFATNFVQKAAEIEGLFLNLMIEFVNGVQMTMEELFSKNEGLVADMASRILLLVLSDKISSPFNVREKTLVKVLVKHWHIFLGRLWTILSHDVPPWTKK